MITIKIKTENDAFVENKGEEVARILRKIADDFAGLKEAKSSYNDINGNKVAEVK